MPSSSAALRSLVLAMLGLGAASAFAQGSNVTAFNPYSGVGLPGGPPATYGPQATYPIVDSVEPASGGPAFNPWQAVGQTPMAGTSAGAFNPGRDPVSGPAPLSGPSLRQIELRAYAGGTDPESRKIALARALVVRSYLIDRGVKSRIEVGSGAGDGDRVDILVPNT